MPKNSASPGRIYIDVVDSSKMAPGLADKLVRSLDNSRFRRVDSPSKAGYILTVTLLAHARTSLPALEKAVNSGYGSKINLSGTETSAIIADVLLIQRRIPAHKRAEHQKMKNISSRNALATAKMRIAIELENQTEAKEADRLLAREIARAIRQ